MARIVERVGGWGSRLSGIGAFSNCGLTIPDKVKMAVVGYARGHTFDSPGFISRLGRTLFPELRVRPAALGGYALHLDPSNLSHLVAVDELLLQHVYEIEEVLFKPDVVIDCGANIGVF